MVQKKMFLGSYFQVFHGFSFGWTAFVQFSFLNLQLKEDEKKAASEVKYEYRTAENELKKWRGQLKDKVKIAEKYCKEIKGTIKR